MQTFFYNKSVRLKRPPVARTKFTIQHAFLKQLMLKKKSMKNKFDGDIILSDFIKLILPLEDIFTGITLRDTPHIKKNEHFVFIYSPSCGFKPVSFFFERRYFEERWKPNNFVAKKLVAQKKVSHTVLKHYQSK